MVARTRTIVGALAVASAVAGAIICLASLSRGVFWNLAYQKAIAGFFGGGVVAVVFGTGGLSITENRPGREDAPT